MAEISVVIPVYNVEKYLDGCIHSVLNQSFRDFELILVDDGSPDRCPQMCDEWAAQDPRIQVIHQTNGGLDAARKAGTERCKGEYILFLDSDDFLMPEVLYQVTDAMRQQPACDIMQMGYRIIFPDGKTHDMHDFSILFASDTLIDGWEFLRRNCLKADTLWNAWSKVYRTSFMQKVHMEALPRHACEDLESLVTYCLYGCKFAYHDLLLIGFRSQREGSITTHISAAYMKGYNESMVRICNQIAKTDLVDKAYVKGYFAKLMLHNSHEAWRLPDKERREICAEAKRAAFSKAKSNDHMCNAALWTAHAFGIRCALYSMRLGKKAMRVKEMIHRH